jgi:ribonuclease HI
VKVFTDGSKDGSHTGSAWISDDNFEGLLISDIYSVFSSEMLAIWQGLEKAVKKKSKVLICTDSLSSLNALQNYHNRHQLTWTILKTIKDKELDVVFLWIPSHVGYQPNELADYLAKNPRKTFDAPITFTDAKNYLIQESLKKFQTWWENTGDSKLKTFKPLVRSWDGLSELTRREATIITRLRLGHTLLTHSHLFSKEPVTKCICDAELSVSHIFTCQARAHLRRACEIENETILQLDTHESYKKTIKYITLIGYAHKI